MEEDSDECEGTSTSRGSGTSEGADAEAGRRGKDVGGELSAGEEAVAALSGRRSQKAAASQRRQKFQSGEARDIPAEGAGADPGEVFGNGAGAVWAYAGSGTFGGCGWVGSGGGDAATLDVGGGVMEPDAPTESAPEAPRTAAALRRVGAAGG
jgi:hypothetical protein